MIKDYGSKISWQRIKILEIQHFLALRGLSRAEIFRFENFHPQLKLAGVHMFSRGVQQISTGGTITNCVYPICFLQGYSWVCKGCTLVHHNLSYEYILEYFWDNETKFPKVCWLGITKVRQCWLVFSEVLTTMVHILNHQLNLHH